MTCRRGKCLLEGSGNMQSPQWPWKQKASSWFLVFSILYSMDFLLHSIEKSDLCLVQARSLICLCWKEVKGPTIGRWLGESSASLVLEKLTLIWGHSGELKVQKKRQFCPFFLYCHSIFFVVSVVVCILFFLRCNCIEIPNFTLL